MTKQAFLSELKRGLETAPAHIRDEIMADISEHFTEAITQGLTEDEVARNLGDPQTIANQVLEEYGETRQHRNHYAPPAENVNNVFEGIKSIFGGRNENSDIDTEQSFYDIREINVKLSDANLRFVPSGDGRTRVTLRGKTRSTIELDGSDGVLTLADSSHSRPFSWFNFGFKANLSATVYVPAGFSGYIKARTAAGNITASDISGRLDFKASAGNVTVTNCEGSKMRFTSSAGNVNADLTGKTIDDIQISTAAGNAKITADETGHLKLNSAAGNVDANVLRLYGNTKVASAAGTVTLRSLSVEGDIDINTAAGSVMIYLPADVNCRIDAKKPTVGSVSNNITGNPNSPYTLRASTAVGSVTIRAIKDTAKETAPVKDPREN
jgi:DUF4097 and DUF4098 domain-containing protein YvlB